MVNKKGSGHFEMVIAFVFFSGFVFFLFMTLQPGSNDSLFDFAIMELEDTFFNYTNVELGSVFLKVSYVKTNPCFFFNLSEDIFDFTFSGKGVFVTDLNGNEINSGFDGNNMDIESGEDFFRIKISEEFNITSLTGCTEASSYELGDPIQSNVVSYNKLVKIKERYYSDYNNLKKDLKIPVVFDFAIVPLSMSELAMLPSNDISDSIEVLAGDKVFEVLKPNGSIINERISFRVW